MLVKKKKDTQAFDLKARINPETSNNYIYFSRKRVSEDEMDLNSCGAMSSKKVGYFA